MAQYKQDSFIGGLNRQFDPTKIADDEYPLLINGRIRNNQVETIQLPKQITFGLPDGENLQSIYAAGFYLFAFIDGNAYYRNFGAGSTDQDSFVKIDGFQLDKDVDRIFAEIVPGSTVNFRRQAQTQNVASDGVHLTDTISGSPDCAYVTDGINQGRIIFPDASSRVTQTWNEWQNNDDGSLREYVPIGTYPLYSNGILYQAGLDSSSGRLNRILRSVTGRPLDYMIIVDKDGNKVGTINDSGADVMAHRVDFNNLASLNKISSVNAPQLDNSDPPILVGTSYNSYLVYPKLDQPIFSEPQFAQRFLFSTAPLNSSCVIDVITGDTLFIDSKGIVSFNAALLAQNEGKNEPFSRRIHPLFNGITQTVACCTKLDNYIYFGVNTIYGPAIVVYDEITQKWVSIDIYPTVSLIKQFAIISTTTIKRIFFITDDNKLYEAFASPITATCRIYCGEWIEDGKYQRTLMINTAFDTIFTAGQIHATLYTDGKKYQRNIQLTDATINESSVPLALPFGRNDSDTVQHIAFGFQDAPVGYKHGVMIEWNCKATLNEVNLTTNEIDPIVNNAQESLIESAKTTLNNSLRLAFLGWGGSNAQSTRDLVSMIKEQNPDYIVLCGNNNLPLGAISTLQSNVKNYWDQLKQQNRVFAALGSKDLDTLNGQTQLTYFTNGRYFNLKLSNDVELFIVNSGFNSSNVIVEPDGISKYGTQAKWLQLTLNQSTAKWKIIVIWDTPYYSSMGFNDWPLKQWGASLVIGAKLHNYTRIFNEQFSQINIGTGSGGLVSSEPLSDTIKFSYDKTLGYFLIECDNINLNGTFFASPSGDVIDQLQILG